MAGILTLKQQTVFKQDPTKQAQDLKDNQKTAFIPANTKLDFNYIEIKSYGTQSFDSHKHLEVHFSKKIKSIKGDEISTWYVFASHVQKIE
jgi:hypothetical protein